MKGLARMVRVLLLFESAMYSAVTPVLPHYAHALHASKPAIGLLAAGYPAGLIPGALLGGWLAARAGVRRTTTVGLVGFGLAIAGFGLATDLVSLDLLRIVQGIFCGLIWGGGLTWVIAAAPLRRRGAEIGAVIAAATFGTLIGPVLGTFAVTLGTAPVFGITGAVSLALAAWARRQPEPAGHVTPGAPLRQLRDALRAGGFGLGAWLVALEAMFFGATAALLPLRMAHFGAPGWAIGVAFIGASALSSVLSPFVGRAVDRHGPRRTILIGLATGAPLVAALALPHTALALGVLIVIALGAPTTAGAIPAVSLMTEATERAGVTLLLATTAVNLAYAVGETIGAPTAAGISTLAGDGLPLLIIAALLLMTLGMMRPRPLRPGRTGDRGPRPLRLRRAMPIIRVTCRPPHPPSGAQLDRPTSSPPAVGHSTSSGGLRPARESRRTRSPR